jgi:hypothetical protein
LDGTPLLLAAQDGKSAQSAKEGESESMITIVSGLPRSGTSLMMQMLDAGGVSILTDGERQADADNPGGYYEWERIKLLRQEPSCIDEAEGKVVKVISQLLFALPGGREYKVIFMERPLAEVLASQAEMIRHRGSSGAELGQAALVTAFEAHLKQVHAWLRDKTNLSLCRLSYHQVISEPRHAAEAIQNFLERALNVEAMARQVDPGLYRQRF